MPSKSEEPENRREEKEKGRVDRREGDRAPRSPKRERSPASKHERRHKSKHRDRRREASRPSSSKSRTESASRGDGEKSHREKSEKARDESRRPGEHRPSTESGSKRHHKRKHKARSETAAPAAAVPPVPRQVDDDRARLVVPREKDDWPADLRCGLTSSAAESRGGGDGRRVVLPPRDRPRATAAVAPPRGERPSQEMRSGGAANQGSRRTFIRREQRRRKHQQTARVDDRLVYSSSSSDDYDDPRDMAEAPTGQKGRGDAPVEEESGGEDGSRPFACPDARCEADTTTVTRFKRQTDLDRHIQKTHGRGVVFECPVPTCNIAIWADRFSERLPMHIASHHAGDTQPHPWEKMGKKAVVRAGGKLLFCWPLPGLHAPFDPSCICGMSQQDANTMVKLMTPRIEGAVGQVEPKAPAVKLLTVEESVAAALSDDALGPRSGQEESGTEDRPRGAPSAASSQARAPETETEKETPERRVVGSAASLVVTVQQGESTAVPLDARKRRRRSSPETGDGKRTRKDGTEGETAGDDESDLEIKQEPGVLERSETEGYSGDASRDEDGRPGSSADQDAKSNRRAFTGQSSTASETDTSTTGIQLVPGTSMTTVSGILSGSGEPVAPAVTEGIRYGVVLTPEVVAAVRADTYPGQHVYFIGHYERDCGAVVIRNVDHVMPLTHKKGEVLWDVADPRLIEASMAEAAGRSLPGWGQRDVQDAIMGRERPTQEERRLTSTPQVSGAEDETPATPDVRLVVAPAEPPRDVKPPAAEAPAAPPKGDDSLLLGTSGGEGSGVTGHDSTAEQLLAETDEEDAEAVRGLLASAGGGAPAVVVADGTPAVASADGAPGVVPEDGDGRDVARQMEGIEEGEPRRNEAAALGTAHRVTQTTAALYDGTPFGRVSRQDRRRQLNLPEGDTIRLDSVHLSGMEPGCEAPRWASSVWPALPSRQSWQLVSEVRSNTGVSVREGRLCSAERTQVVHAEPRDRPDGPAPRSRLPTLRVVELEPELVLETIHVSSDEEDGPERAPPGV